MTRREFFRAPAGAAFLLVGSGALGEFLESCSGGNPVDSSATNLPVLQGTYAGGAVTVAVDSSSPLANAGGAALVQYTGGALLAARTGTNAFTALSSLCTHQRCTITEYDSGAKKFVCPCHGSQYTTSGQVAQGPAQSPLAAYQTSFANNQLTVQVG